MEDENRKLIYQLSRIYANGLDSQGMVYDKSPKLALYESYNIWAKRAYKKGYLQVVEENNLHTVYKLNEKGLELLKKHKSYYLQGPSNYDIFKPTKKTKELLSEEELKRKRRRERRQLRKLKQMGRNK